MAEFALVLPLMMYPARDRAVRGGLQAVHHRHGRRPGGGAQGRGGPPPHRPATTCRTRSSRRARISGRAHDGERRPRPGTTARTSSSATFPYEINIIGMVVKSGFLQHDNGAHRMNRFKDQGGQTLVISVAFLTVLLGMAALVLDVGSWYRADRSCQATADAAALAGAQALPTDRRGPSRPRAELRGQERRRRQDEAKATLSPSRSPTTITVQVNVRPPGFFSKVFGIDSVTVGARAPPAPDSSARGTLRRPDRRQRAASDAEELQAERLHRPPSYGDNYYQLKSQRARRRRLLRVHQPRRLSNNPGSRRSASGFHGFDGSCPSAILRLPHR